MNTHPASMGGVVHIGVDVCAKWLDIHGLKPGTSKRVANTKAGHAKLIDSLPANAHVVLEASGGYEHALWLALLHADKAVSRINPPV
jgi:transposase